MQKTWSLILLALPAALLGGHPPSSIPRSPAQQFVTSGLFEGGSDAGANLERLRRADHPGFERWVVDFSDLAENMGGAAPRFQLRYEKADKIELPEGGDLIRKPARFPFLFRQIQKNRLDETKLNRLVKKSKFVKEIHLYPPIEKGDMAMEFVLSEDVEFTPHQPLKGEGRLVLDLRAKP